MENPWTFIIDDQNGKVIDAEVLSSYCKVCERNKKIFIIKEEANNQAKVCSKNHSGSSGMMEVKGMEKIFKRLEIKHSVRYIEDGDCKTFQGIVNSQPYGKDVPIVKLECIGHIQKRMRSRLRKKKA